MKPRRATPSDRARQIFIESKGKKSARAILEQLTTEGFKNMRLDTVKKWRTRYKWDSDLSPAIAAELRTMKMLIVPEPDMPGIDAMTIDRVQERILSMAYGISESVRINLEGLRPKRPSDFVLLAQAVTQLATAHAAVTKSMVELAGLTAKDITPAYDGSAGDDRFDGVIDAFSNGGK